ncbi:MAG: ABC transporter substrate-binding protein [Rikenellaceae bacterium]
MVDARSNIYEILESCPECDEFLFPFKESIDRETTLYSLATKLDISVEALQYGIARTQKRAEQNPCDYEKMRAKLIKPNHINVAGFVNFLWQNQFIEELQNEARRLNIALNLNIFPKHTKKELQNYLAICNNPDDLPEVLIGKGFSSLMTQSFVTKFVKSGLYKHPSVCDSIGSVFAESGLVDEGENYHPFGVEEVILLHDKTIPFDQELPTSWPELLQPRYAGSIMQMGKSQRDHFGFNIMLHLYHTLGREGVEGYAANVMNKQHFAYIIKNIAQNNPESAPISVVHQFASKFIPSDLKHDTEIIKTTDGNPCTTIFFLMKQNTSPQAIELIKHLYSPQIREIIERCGTSHITSKKSMSGNTKLQWVGWEKIKELPLPYLKEELSELAFLKYKQ